MPPDMEVQTIFVILSLCFVYGSAMRRPIGQQTTNGNGPLAQLNSIRRNTTFAKYSANIEFMYYNLRGDLVKSSTLDRIDEDYFDVDNCMPDDKFAILLHGWKESCSQEWMRLLIKNLIKYRGGCIICMDYSKYTKQEYPRLLRSFDAITQILTAKLYQMEHLGFSPDNGYMFGFSYGAQLVSEAARRFGTRKLNEIDLCDIAGPGFDYKSAPEHKNAAKNVQCIHTSSDKGTRHTTCDQNWKMGNCGANQPGAGEPPLGSHGLCPYFYNYAFEYVFPAIPKPKECNARREAGDYPHGFRMGYRETRKHLVHGELFAKTTTQYPFTPLINKNRLFNSTGDYDDDDSAGTTIYSADEDNNL